MDRDDHAHTHLGRTAPAALEAGKEVVQVFGVKVVGKLGQQVMDVVDNDFVLVHLRLPDQAEVVERQSLLQHQKLDNLFQLGHILRLVQVVSVGGGGRGGG